jgi:hypothetical protein
LRLHHQLRLHLVQLRGLVRRLNTKGDNMIDETNRSALSPEDDSDLLEIVELEDRNALLAVHGACACTTSCNCTSCSCVGWASSS